MSSLLFLGLAFLFKQVWLYVRVILIDQTNKLKSLAKKYYDWCPLHQTNSNVESLTAKRVLVPVEKVKNSQTKMINVGRIIPSQAWTNTKNSIEGTGIDIHIADLACWAFQTNHVIDKLWSSFHVTYCFI